MFAGIEPFVHVGELGNFRRAAERLGVSPAAVSKAVAKLEAELGVRLLERNSRHVTLTPEGRTFLERARVALDALQSGRDLVAQSTQVVDGVVRISASPALGPTIAAGLPRLLARHPRLQVELAVTDRRVQLGAEDVDVAVRIGPLNDDELVAKPLRRPRWVTVASPVYLGRAGTPAEPRDLVHHSCLRFVTAARGMTDWEFSPPERAPIQVPDTVRVDAGDLLLAGALAGVGVAQVFDFMVERQLADGHLIEILAHRSAPGPSIHAVILPRRRRTARVRAAVAFLEELLPPAS